MTPDVVADVGNTRIKWGRCSADAVVEAVSLPPDDVGAWERQAETWRLPRPTAWAVAGVHPARRDRFVDWLRQRGNVVMVLEDWRSLPLAVRVSAPESVGIDRLLDAVAVNALRQRGRPAVVIDAGSAVTVDWIDETGAFAGGAILPGMSPMGKALHDNTALLPLVDTPKHVPPAVPGTTTATAIEAGVFWAVAGGVWALVAAYSRRFDASPEVFLTGGDAALLAAAKLGPAHLVPLLTLSGLRLAAITSAGSGSTK
jgi:type III pantothenate kinase